MEQARAPALRRPSRTAVIAGAVVAAYLAFAVFAQLVGEDEDARIENAEQLDVFCAVLYSDYPGMLSTVADQGGAFGPATRAEAFFPGFTSALAVAPEEFQEETAYLIEGLERAFSGELTPVEMEAYVEAYDELQAEATPLCDQVGRDILDGVVAD
jgi:hypothetical protein